jgi:hypothetical protein
VQGEERAGLWAPVLDPQYNRVLSSGDMDQAHQSALAQQLAGQLPQGLRFGHGCAMLREEPVALASTSVRTSQRRSRAASWTKSPTTAGQGLGRTCCSAVTNGSTVPQGQPAVEALVGELGALVNL